MVERIRRAAEEGWDDEQLRASVDVADAAKGIVGELNDFEKAINDYKKALATENCDVTLRDLEKLLNLRVLLRISYSRRTESIRDGKPVHFQRLVEIATIFHLLRKARHPLATCFDLCLS